MLEAFDLEEEKNKALKDEGRLTHKISAKVFPRRWYATGNTPNLSLPPEFSAVLDPKKKISNTQKIMFSIKEVNNMFRNNFFSLEANSFLSWHIGSVASFLKDTIPIIESGDIQNSVARLKEGLALLSSLDKAVSDSVSLLVPSVSAWILRLREHYLSFLHPKVSSLSKSRALYSSLDFHSLFDSSLLKDFLEEIKVQDVSDLSRRVAMVVRSQPPPQPRPRFNLRPSRGRAPIRRSSRPFRGGRSRRPPNSFRKNNK